MPLSSLQAQLGKTLIIEEHQEQSLPNSDSPPVSPRGSDDTGEKQKEEARGRREELFLLHQALNSDFLSSHHLLKAGLYQDRDACAQVHAAVSVAGVAAAVAALATSSVTSPEQSITQHKTSSKMSTAIASAAALVASHCIEIAEDMGAEQDQILSVVNSAINARTSGTSLLTAGAATALRGAATLKGKATERKWSCRGTAQALQRKGDLHWKQVSFNINSDWQEHSAKKEMCSIWNLLTYQPGLDGTEHHEQKCYFGIQTADRMIEFECRNKAEKQMWVDGIQQISAAA
ncbi:hypothetical protein HAX54_047402 [Datura stramonium]|uniref:PH domain-containing protein n=1 Tax=Datura stramonium TaxID=4076 RepID=A0ABS8WM30_DATST|nr:hypothetical protein [Datura stramonium]